MRPIRKLVSLRVQLMRDIGSAVWSLVERQSRRSRVKSEGWRKRRKESKAASNVAEPHSEDAYCAYTLLRPLDFVEAEKGFVKKWGAMQWVLGTSDFCLEGLFGARQRRNLGDRPSLVRTSPAVNKHVANGGNHPPLQREK